MNGKSEGTKARPELVKPRASQMKGSDLRGWIGSAGLHPDSAASKLGVPGWVVHYYYSPAGEVAFLPVALADKLAAAKVASVRPFNGPDLAAFRERLGLSVDEAGELLGVRGRMVEAVEAGTCQADPGLVSRLAALVASNPR